MSANTISGQVLSVRQVLANEDKMLMQAGVARCRHEGMWTGVTDLLEVSPLHRHVLDLSEIDVTKEMGRLRLWRQKHTKITALPEGGAPHRSGKVCVLVGLSDTSQTGTSNTCPHLQGDGGVSVVHVLLPPGGSATYRLP